MPRLLPEAAASAELHHARPLPSPGPLLEQVAAPLLSLAVSTGAAPNQAPEAGRLLLPDQAATQPNRHRLVAALASPSTSRRSSSGVTHGLGTSKMESPRLPPSMDGLGSSSRRREHDPGEAAAALALVGRHGRASVREVEGA
jgi:hypothetical protein